MSRFTYPEFLEGSRGTPFSAENPFESARLWTDTRTIQAGDFFLPLSGERFDGHDYLEQAFASGAIGAFVKKEKADRHPEWAKLPNLIAVDEPVLAYLAMARFHRQRINPLVIAVTGSSGKTTTKEMLYAALSPLKKTVKTEKNFNNEVGVSQTLLGLTPGTEILIVEMGMRGLRQISILSEAALPDAAMIVNIGPAHIGLLGSLENIAKAKLEIVEGMDPEKGILVIDGETPFLSEMAPRCWPGQIIHYGLGEADHIDAFSHDHEEGVRFTYKGVPVALAVPGEHMVSNALGVLKLGEALGFEICDLAKGLSAFVPEKGRWERMPLAGYRNVWVINDAYNANPDSMKASLKAFLAVSRPDTRNILILGGMKELDAFSESYHVELGQWLAGRENIHALYLVGNEAEWMARGIAGKAGFPVYMDVTVDGVIDKLRACPPENAILYLKGSRAYKLDEIPDALGKQHSQVGETR